MAACNRLPPESQPVGVAFQLLPLGFDSFAGFVTKINASQ